MVRAVGLGDGNAAVPDGDGVAAAVFGSDGELLIHPEVYGFDDCAPAADFRKIGSISGQQQENAQSEKNRRSGGNE